MKQGQLKTQLTLLGIFLLLALVVFAWTAPTPLSPVDNSFNKTGTIVVNCTVTPLAQLMVLNISLWHNGTGTYTRSTTVSSMRNNTGLVSDTVFNLSVSENQHVSWACTYDEGNGTAASTFNFTIQPNITANRTVVVDLEHPDISVVWPVGIMTEGSGSFDQNITVRVEDEHFGNASTCIIFTNTSGSWTANVTNNSLGGEVGGFGGGATNVVNLNLSFKPMPSGIYSFYATCNDSAGRYTALGNQTFRVVAGPIVTLNYGADAWVKDSFNVTFTAQTRPGSVGTTVTGVSNDYNCELFTNESALTTGVIGGSNWSRVATFIAQNATQTSTLSYAFAASSLVGSNVSFRTGIKCYESGRSEAYNWSVNQTVRVDDTLPNVTIVSVDWGDLNQMIVGPANGTNVSNTSLMAQIGVLASDDNLANCTLYGEFNTSTSGQYGKNLTLWASNGDITSGTRFNFTDTAFLAGNGSWEFNVWCEDNATNRLISPNYTVNVNTNGIFFRSANETGIISGFNGTALGRKYTGKCDAINITIQTPNLATTVSVNYSSENDGAGVITSGAGYATTHNITLPFNTSEDSINLNWTAKDYYLRSNTSGNMRIKLPAKLCTRWSGYSLTLTSGMTMFNITTQSGADSAHYWNTTRQAWVSYVAGAAKDQNVFIPQGHAVFLYEGTNSSWRRIINSTAYYNYNITGWNGSADNFLGVVQELTFRDVNATFKNGTAGITFENGTAYFATVVSTGDKQNRTSQTAFNFTSFAWWNNTNQRWVNYIAGRATNPDFTLANGSGVLWMYAYSYNSSNIFGQNGSNARNVTWNGTSINNWTGWAS